MIKFINKLPYIRGLVKQNQTLKHKVSELSKKIGSLHVPPGHYYSPIVNVDEVVKNEARIWSDNNREIQGVSLNDAEQFELLKKFEKHYNLIDFPVSKSENHRYYFDNVFYTYSDAVFLFCTILEFQPKRIIEIGSGFSSAVILDVNQKFFQNKIKCEFIEPFPERLNSLLTPTDNIKLYERNAQELNPQVFESLEANDILFVDSTHVSKTGSDVNYILFEVLPRLAKGVKIHFHDIFYPFEYPKDWVIDKKRCWNEIYLLRAFLSYNTDFKIIAFNTYLEHRYKKWFEDHMPLCLKNTGGSIWLEKVS